jgi:hypothetical protein
MGAILAARDEFLQDPRVVLGDRQPMRQSRVVLRGSPRQSGKIQAADGIVGDPLQDVAASLREVKIHDLQGPLRTMLEEALNGAELEAAVSMLTGVVACPSIMFGTLPDDDVIAAAVDIVLRSARYRKSPKR